MPDCVFCAIVAGEAPARVVREDDRTLAFLDIFPLTRGHALVVPKHHSENLLDCPPDDLVAVALSAQEVARASKEAFGWDGLNLLQTNGAAALQTVFHLHVHVLPRYVDDSFTVSFERRPGTAADLDDAAAALRAAIR